MTEKQRAEQGIITPEMKSVAEYEDLEPEFIRQGVAEGSIVIPHNSRRSFPSIRGIGKGLKTKINTNIGSSPYHMVVEEEVEKLNRAISLGTDAVMDLSLGSRLIQIRRELLAASSVMFGTVPIYQTVAELSIAQRDLADMTLDDFLATVEQQAADGVDFMTIHSGVNLKALESFENQPRILDIVSRGGSILVSWMRKNRKESPLYEHFDEILDILVAYDVTISLGDGMRPGATADATDRSQITELITLGELAQRAWDKGVQVIIEGPGHIPLHMIEENVKIEKALCKNAPFYVLGPLVTDCAAGYDHIAGAIGGALAAYHGADFLCYVTPAEHLRLPTIHHVMDGVMASRIAAHAADLAKGKPSALERERAMAQARKTLDWERQFEASLHPEKAREERVSSEIGQDSVCTMCGEFCAIKRLLDT